MTCSACKWCSDERCHLDPPRQVRPLPSSFEGVTDDWYMDDCWDFPVVKADWFCSHFQERPEIE
jgi:hypothetical protein